MLVKLTTLNHGSAATKIALIVLGVLGCEEVKFTAKSWTYKMGEHFHSTFAEDLNDNRIPEVPVEYAGEVGLVRTSSIELALNQSTPAIGPIMWMGITPSNTLLLADRFSGEAHEFNLNDGHHLRGIGRRGKGPGEYGRVRTMAMDSKGEIYIHDATYAQLLRYSRHGVYRNEKMHWPGSADLLIDRNDGLLLLERKYGEFLQIRRILGLNGKVVYTLPLFNKKDRLISSFLVRPAQVCYNSHSDRLYFLEANGYMVKEIDAGMGKVVRKFGTLVPSYSVSSLEKQPPPPFRFLPEKYHDLRSGSNPMETSEIINQISVANSMTLIGNRFLLVSHRFPYSTNDWTLYDLDSMHSSPAIKAYSLDRPAYQSLNGTNEDSLGVVSKFSTIDGRISSRQNQIYVYKPPPIEIAESSNGKVETYVLSLKQ